MALTRNVLIDRIFLPGMKSDKLLDTISALNTPDRCSESCIFSQKISVGPKKLGILSTDI